MLNMYYNAEEVAELLKISKGKSYAIIRDLNKELEQKGFITISGKVPRKYLEERCYGIAEREAQVADVSEVMLYTSETERRDIFDGKTE